MSPKGEILICNISLFEPTAPGIQPFNPHEFIHFKTGIGFNILGKLSPSKHKLINSSMSTVFIINDRGKKVGFFSFITYCSLPRTSSVSGRHGVFTSWKCSSIFAEWHTIRPVHHVSANATSQPLFLLCYFLHIKFCFVMHFQRLCFEKLI